ncbi:pentatricopeptide repeat-containing protein At3g02490, mitochondrial-like isoform X1 [Cucurbita moschata]|uniref:Pentatricopeptide repeat-containing protein At3g02490, mitochondrial-like isoform X1 n=2 Tax=Cucurbita moschata TaxID=3662 RepID=A0A6J1E5F8_CUCMO|nr:pentatricopeptide repeat-containing protein At3g02490, mitochondrial-like isoform X1 [Cucurbita moschata]
MRYSWRLLRLRAHFRCQLLLSSNSSHFQVLSNPNLQSLRYFSSLLRKYPVHDTSIVNSRYSTPRMLSSEPEIGQKDSAHAVVFDIFSKCRDVDEIRKGLESSGVVISHDLVLEVLGKLESNPDEAIRFFGWVSGDYGEKLSSKSYNLMLGILGVNGRVEEFWDLNCDMKKKGYGISKSVQNKVLEKFEKDGLESEAEKLRDVFASGSIDKSPEKIGSIVCKLVRKNVWGDDVEQQLRDMNISLSSDMVKMILENLCTEPAKAFIFFRWIGESGMFKHDEQTYNAMARVLGREDSIDRFWKVVDEMRSHGYEMEVETFSEVLRRFCKRKMIEEAVNLYVFAMAGGNKPSVDCLTFLLKKIAVSKHLDLSLFSRALKIFTETGNALTDSMVFAVLKSLSTVGRIGEYNEVLNAMKEYGYVFSGGLKRKVAYQLSSTGKSDEANDFVNSLEASGCNSDNKTWAALIEGYCVAGDLAKASDCIHKMVEKGVDCCAGYTLDLVVNAYCQKKRETDASRLFCDLVDEKQLKPWHSTYKALINKLLVRGEFREALKLLGMMRNHEFPPFIDPFILYVSKSGTADDAIGFLKAMTSKSFPSTTVFLHLFEAFFQAGRHGDAQDFLSKCPGYIRNHADVLELFNSMKHVEAAAPPPNLAS